MKIENDRKGRETTLRRQSPAAGLAPLELDA
jgi:hypothetical protein